MWDCDSDLWNKRKELGAEREHFSNAHLEDLDRMVYWIVAAGSEQLLLTQPTSGVRI
jgi:hypothetical protein